ncbi:NAD(P)H-hydrate dehydratase [Metabacillus sp. KIGAM252]|uniref:Bifunctional NAD(P)H-hydrate repair enzyme n=1 Tax=Metabacillus flavus TaxID=2823519 RepID=A0ABS5LDG5_9BACI|nr:NAD(P)H-hydrate dehydratase [Metabacillus flavus]MBS2968788.1 NAD(P)H-hydrate dehydratase [Metabacillus flavus]
MFIFTKEDIRHIDRQAEERGLSEFTLMENAGAGLYREISSLITKQQRICIAAGKGNNGGDGIVLARYLLLNGYQANLFFPFGPPEEDGTAGRHFRYLKACGFSPVTDDLKGDVIVDALFGIGFQLPLREEAKVWIRQLNGEPALKISIDIPSGVEADHGSVSEAFRADYTFCLHGYKPSAFLVPSGTYYGKTAAVPIGLPQEGKIRVWTEEDAINAWPSFAASAHKGIFGTGYIIAGSDHMPGSALLAAKGALRSGIGKLIIGTSQFASAILAGEVPETTYEFDGLEKTANGSIPKKLKAAAIGPGLENEDLIEQAVQTLLEGDFPVVLDAGALQKRRYMKREIPPILTPHPGEFSRMTGLTVKDIQSSRIQTALQYAAENEVILILKGEQTVIAFPDGDAIINLTGNSALAKGGSGDTLTGILTACLCTHRTIKEAAANAVLIHGMTADLWVSKYGVRTMTASDISDMIPEVMKNLENKKGI